MDKRRRAMRETAAAEAGRTPISPLSLVAAVVDAMPEDAIVVDESISSGHGVRELLRSGDPKSFYGIRGGGIGWGLPAALGVKLAQPSRPVVAEDDRYIAMDLVNPTIDYVGLARSLGVPRELGGGERPPKSGAR
jgi:thiamine pyrophosphate-dependent acetolactate synthase large subunit-like protein